MAVEVEKMPFHKCSQDRPSPQHRNSGFLGFAVWRHSTQINQPPARGSIGMKLSPRTQYGQRTTCSSISGLSLLRPTCLGGAEDECCALFGCQPLPGFRGGSRCFVGNSQALSCCQGFSASPAALLAHLRHTLLQRFRVHASVRVSHPGTLVSVTGLSAFYSPITLQPFRVSQIKKGEPARMLGCRSKVGGFL
jgi:hypothetical protein